MSVVGNLTESPHFGNQFASPKWVAFPSAGEVQSETHQDSPPWMFVKAISAHDCTIAKVRKFSEHSPIILEALAKSMQYIS